MGSNNHALLANNPEPPCLEAAAAAATTRNTWYRCNARLSHHVEHKVEILVERRRLLQCLPRLYVRGEPVAYAAGLLVVHEPHHLVRVPLRANVRRDQLRNLPKKTKHLSLSIIVFAKIILASFHSLWVEASSLVFLSEKNNTQKNRHACTNHKTHTASPPLSVPPLSESHREEGKNKTKTIR